MHALAHGLTQLSHGDLDFSIDTPFADHLDSLREDFNKSVAGLHRTLFAIRGTSGLISDNGRQMAQSVDALAKRTEQQAAALEEAAAAVEQISAAVSTSSNRADATLELVHKAFGAGCQRDRKTHKRLRQGGRHRIGIRRQRGRRAHANFPGDC